MDKVEQLKLVKKLRDTIKIDVSISGVSNIKVETRLEGEVVGCTVFTFDHWQSILGERAGLNYCSECLVPDHDACSLVDGCPCCDNTKWIQNSQT